MLELLVVHVLGVHVHLGGIALLLVLLSAEAIHHAFVLHVLWSLVEVCHHVIQIGEFVGLVLIIIFHVILRCYLKIIIGIPVHLLELTSDAIVVLSDP